MDVKLEDYNFYIKPGVTENVEGFSQSGIHRPERNEAPALFQGGVPVLWGTRRTIKAIVWDRNGWVEIFKDSH